MQMNTDSAIGTIVTARETDACAITMMNAALTDKAKPARPMIKLPIAFACATRNLVTVNSAEMI